MKCKKCYREDHTQFTKIDLCQFCDTNKQPTLDNEVIKQNSINNEAGDQFYNKLKQIIEY